MSPPDEVLKIDVPINGRNANTIINDSKKLQLDMLNKMVAEKNKDYNPKYGGTFYFLVDPSQSHTIKGDNVKIETSYSISSKFNYVEIPMDKFPPPPLMVVEDNMSLFIPPKPVVETVKPQSLPSQPSPPSSPPASKPPLKSTGKRRKLRLGNTIKENIYYLNKGRIARNK